jgi:hypothetical protein
LQVLVIKTDGGPDRNCTFAGVQLAYLCLVLHLDLDMLILLRTAPGQSYVNPVERVMSVLNLAMQGLALARARCSDELEAKLKGASSVKSIRQVLDAVTQFVMAVDAEMAEQEGPSKAQQYADAMRAPIEQLEKAFEVCVCH